LDLSKLMFWKRHDVHEAPGGSTTSTGGNTSSPGVQINQGNADQFVIKAIGFQGESDNQDFESSPIDLKMIKNAVNTEPYIERAVLTYSQLLFKAGYSIVSNNDDAARYVRQRLNMMSFATGTPIDILFQQIGQDLVTFSNAFLIKSRVDSSQLGGIQAQGVFDTNPVGGYFRVDPSTIQIKRDKTGAIKSYQQQSGSNTKKFKPTDVIHLYVNKFGGDAFGTPIIQPVLEDVKLLRKIEGNVTQLIYRFAMPLYQMKIGLPQPGMQATEREISEAKTAVEQMNADGIMVTNEATEFKAIGAEGTALDASKYLQYFEQRVITGLNMSMAMMGRGGNASDADSMEAQVHNMVKFYQQTFAIMIENFMFNELLMEGGFSPVGGEDDVVNFRFKEINTETRVKMDTHALNLYQGNLITLQEARQMLGIDSDDVDTSQMFANVIQQPNAMELVNAKLASTGTGGGGGANTGTSGPSKSAPSGAAKTASSTMQPKNQHGTSSASIKESLDLNESSNMSRTEEHVEDYQKKFSEIYKKYSSASNDVCERNEKPDLILPLTFHSIGKSLKATTAVQMGLGVEKAIRDSKVKDFASKKLTTKLLDDKIDKTLKKMFKDIQRRLKEAKDDVAAKRAAFDAVEYRLRFLAVQIVDKAYWYGYVKACGELKIDQVYVNFGKSEDREDHDAVINTHAFTLDDIPAYNSYCSCKIGIHKGR